MVDRPSDEEITRMWRIATRSYRRGSSLGKKIGLAIADQLDERGVTEGDIDRLFVVAKREEVDGL